MADGADPLALALGEYVNRFLDHSSLAVTSTYLRRLEGQRDLGWAKVAEAVGCERVCCPPA